MSDYVAPVAAVLLPNLGGILGGFSARPKNKTWFQALKAPKFKPPNWVFAPVWTTLYSTMGYASYMVWRDGGGFEGDALLPLTCYGTQLALNWAWSPIFFGYHKMGLSPHTDDGYRRGSSSELQIRAGIEDNLKALIDQGILLGAVIATILTFKKVNPTASYMLLPYLGWISFATYLTFSYWKLNKDRTD